MNINQQTTPALDDQETDEVTDNQQDNQQDDQVQEEAQVQDEAQVTDDQVQEDDQVTEPETFPREYVEKLRKEAAEHRAKAKRVDDLAHALFVERVRATGRLADPTDLPYSDEAVDDQEKLVGAIDELLARKPHLASRRVRGDVGQGMVGSTAGSVDLAGMLRARV